MSLGPFPEISLDEARARHAALRKKVIADKVDPMAEKERGKANAPKSAPAAVPSFGEMADTYIAAHEKSWRNPKHAQQWVMTLTKYCAPIRPTPVHKVDAQAVLRVLEPIWTRAPETSSRLRGRIEAVLAAAQVAGHIDPDKPNPARWKGWLDHMLANPKKIGERGNHAAMDWRDVPAFVAKLRTMGSTASAALEFAILCASRTGEALDMTWDEVDLDTATWTIPKERMKMDRPHNVPLSPRAVDILRGQFATRPTSSFGPHPYVFPGRRLRSGLSNMSFLMLLRRMKVDVTTHGFRATFRTWCADHAVAFEVAEACLAHTSASVVAAYQRSSSWSGAGRSWRLGRSMSAARRPRMSSRSGLRDDPDRHHRQGLRGDRRDAPARQRAFSGLVWWRMARQQFRGSGR
jgi:integrase